MIHKEVDSLAWVIKKAKEKNGAKPIVLLGAGASVSAGIPLAEEIMADILEQFKDKPEIKNLDPNGRDYAKVMGCLNAMERNDLLRNYIKRAKINVAHIYLAQLLKYNYIDYVLTVNFDDLMLRASALFNFIPPTYDMAILKDTTTTTLPTGSVVYLHGQQHGLWLLNTEAEMTKVKERVAKIFNKICNDRPWIIIGYSGCDPVFDVLATKLGDRFDNGLYWVNYLDTDPSNHVKEMLLDKENKEAYCIKNYNSDSFFLKLHAELGMDTPAIFNTPFSYLKSVTENIQDINIPRQESSDSKKTNTQIELFKHTKERSENSKKLIEDAIKVYERVEHQDRMSETEIIDNNFQKSLIELITKQDYTKAEELLENYEDKNSTLYNTLRNTLYTSWAYADYEKWLKDPKDEILEGSIKKYSYVDEAILKDEEVYNNWGVAIYQKAYVGGGGIPSKEGLNESIEKYKKAIELNPQHTLAYGNWALALNELGRRTSEEKYYLESIEKLQMAVKLDPHRSSNYINWGNSLLDMAKIKGDDNLYFQSIEKYKIASDLAPKDSLAYGNWSIALQELGYKNSDEKYFRESIEKLKEANDRGANEGINNMTWGNLLSEIGKINKDPDLYFQSIEKYEKALELKQPATSVYVGIGNSLVEIAKLKNETDLYTKSIEKYQKALELDPQSEFAYLGLGNAYFELGRLNGKSELYYKSLENYKKALELNARLADVYIGLGNDYSELSIIEKSKELNTQSINNFKKALDISPNFAVALDNLGVAQRQSIAFSENEYEKAAILNEAEKNLEKASKLDGLHYNIACLYALQGKKEKALEALEKSLSKKQQTPNFIQNDADWKSYLTDPAFLDLLNKYN